MNLDEVCRQQQHALAQPPAGVQGQQVQAHAAMNVL